MVVPYLRGVPDSIFHQVSVRLHISCFELPPIHLVSDCYSDQHGLQICHPLKTSWVAGKLDHHLLQLIRVMKCDIDKTTWNGLFFSFIYAHTVRPHV
ncbi:hypothetical protein TNCV_2708301 [Trichonephila clavipes]|nr:hypothetical protein TNCV_2708301 [Trichonephila clavipes]